MTPMIKTQVYLEEEDLAELHRVAKLRKRRVADLIREAVRVTWLRPKVSELPGPVSLWKGKARPGRDHDTIYDEP